MRNRWRLIGRTALAFALVTGLMVVAVGPALALVQVDVGISNAGDTSRDSYRDSDLTGANGVLPGEQIDFFFTEASHNVIWVSTNPAPLPNSSPGTFQDNPGGTTFSVTMPSATGTYVYFCGIHSNQAEALAANDFGAGEPNGMYGRIEVLADTTEPTWTAGSATATPISASSIDLTYPAATDDSGTAFYDIYQASGATDPGKGAASLVGNNVSGTSYSALGLSAGVHYWFWITAVDGAGNQSVTDQTADATTSSVAASDSATGVLSFDVNATLSVSVLPATLNMGNLDPVTGGAGSTTATVQSNNPWSMSIKSIGANGTDEAPGDDQVFTATGGTTIPVGRATWDASGSGGASGTLDDIGGTVVTGMPATASTDVTVDWAVALLFDDPAGTNYQTTVLYTVTQP